MVTRMSEVPPSEDRYGALATLSHGGQRLHYVDQSALGRAGLGPLDTLPYCLRVVLENLVRNLDGEAVQDSHVRQVASWSPSGDPFVVPMTVSRVILPDSSGLPALMDIAALRAALSREGVPPMVVGPQIPVDVVIDHSLIVERAGGPDAEAYNVRKEFERNAERYGFFKWAQQAFDGLRVVPPGMGIVHQVNIERLAEVIATEQREDGVFAFPEFILGGDSHTPMVNALGVLGWGVGGIEAEAALLGQPHMVRIGRVVAVRLKGRLGEGSTTTDLVLHVTQRLREVGVVGEFVEFTGPGLASLSLPERATLANMAPEYGATAGFFAVDDATLEYLRQTGRSEAKVDLVERYCKSAGLFRDPDGPEPRYSETVEIDLSKIEPSVAGPSRPQDRQALSCVQPSFRACLDRPLGEGGFAIPASERGKRVTIEIDGEAVELGHGSIVLAAITSCTNTSNPSVMLGAGLLARKAVEAGLSPRRWVKSSLAPGSRVVTRYLERTGLLPFLEKLGFYVVGYGCASCSGKSGSFAEGVTRAIEEDGLVAVAMASSNRNFEGRIHRLVRANYIGSPMLVVAYALAGRIDIDFVREPLGTSAKGRPVYLRDIWPSGAEISALVAETRDPALYRENYAQVFDGTRLWHELVAPTGPYFPWSKDSTYILEPPFYAESRLRHEPGLPDVLDQARALCVFGDSLTTDHISPAGEIPLDSPAGRYLCERGVPQEAFNAYTQRRGNHEVLVRGTFANVRIKNLMVPESEGGVTVLLPEGTRCAIYDAAAVYSERGTPIIVLAGRDYGMGSSRDWAAKGPALLGIRAVIAASYERIHRANLIGLGILPLCFRPEEDWRTLGLDGTEVFTLRGLVAGVEDGSPIEVSAQSEDGRLTTFSVKAALESPIEVAYLRNGGIFATVYRRLAAALPAQASGPDAHAVEG